MAVTIQLYNHTPQLFAAQEVDLANIRAELLDNSATFTATHTAKHSVDNGAAPATVTMTIATPGVITDTAHGFSAGQPVMYETTGALPTGITAGTWYYVLAASLATDSYRIGATPGGAAIDTTGSQSGTHTRYASGSYEFHGNGWPVGGPVLASAAVTTVAINDGTVNDAKLDATDVEVTADGGSISGYKAQLYDGTSKKPLAFIDFGQLQAAGDTTEFKIRWNANGILNWTNAA